MSFTYMGVTIPEPKGAFAQHFLYFFQREHESLWSALRGLTAEQMDWKPSREAFSIAEITEHILETERVLLEADLLGNPLDPKTLPEPSYLWGRAGGARSGLPADIYIADLQASCQRVLDYMAGLDDAALQEPKRLWDGKREQKVMERIEILIGHLLYHNGQIQFIPLLDGFPGGGGGLAGTTRR